MTHRHEPRIPIQQIVRLTVLKEQEEVLTARIEATSGAMLDVTTSTPINPGTALKLELDDCMLLGEAIQCGSSGEHYLVRIGLEQAIMAVSDVVRLVSSIMGESSRDPRIEAPPIRLMRTGS